MKTESVKACCECRHLSFEYGKHRVLRDLNIRFESGTVNYIVGQAGSGKTTLAHILSGVIKPSKGDVILGGTHPPALVMQFPENLFLTDTIEEELSLLPDVSSEERALSFLSSFDLSFAEIAHKHPSRLSFGQRRLLAIALQSAISTSLLILDEPTLGLDDRNLQIFSSWLRRQLPEIDVMVITHDLELIEQVAGQVHILQDGRFVWNGRSEMFICDPDLLTRASAN